MSAALDAWAQNSCTGSLVACVSIPQQAEELGDWHHEAANEAANEIHSFWGLLWVLL